MKLKSLKKLIDFDQSIVCAIVTDENYMYSFDEIFIECENHHFENFEKIDEKFLKMNVMLNSLQCENDKLYLILCDFEKNNENDNDEIIL